MIGQGGHDDPRTAAPDGLPVLSAGRHSGPHRGSCVMEYVSVLAGEPWSDHPRCTDRALAELARRVNDAVRSDARPALAELAPLLAGARGPEVATDVVVAAVARVGLEETPADPVLTRLYRSARRRVARGGGDRFGARVWRGLVRFGRVAGGAGVGDTYSQLERSLAGRPRAERDAVRVRALEAAVADVRRFAGLPADLSATDLPAGPPPVTGPPATRPGPVDAGATDGVTPVTAR